MTTTIRRLLAALLASLALAGNASAAEGGIPWDRFPVEKLSDNTALQNGARLFVNYCLNCHSAAYMRYNRLRDIGLSEDQIEANLLFAGDKVGETMKVSVDPKQAKEWFGGVPPDLTVIARSRSAPGKGSGADYLYTYLRTFYRDDTKATGWNNLAYPNVGMPHALWELQGQQRAVFVEQKDAHDPSRATQVFKGFEPITPGQLTPLQYDDAIGDLVAYMQWMAEPAQTDRIKIGVVVLIFLGVLTIVTWRLNAAYWRDVT